VPLNHIANFSNHIIKQTAQSICVILLQVVIDKLIGIET